MNNANLTIAIAAELGSNHTGPGAMSQSFVVAACASDIDTLELFEAFTAAKFAAQHDAATAELAATGNFETLPSVIAYRAR